MTSFVRSKNLLDFFPVPEYLLLSTAGVAITDSDTKFVELRREVIGGGLKLVNSYKVANPKGAIESGLIKNPTQLKPILKKLSLDYSIRYAHATLPDEKAYLFTTSIDRVPPEGLRDAVAFVIEANAPVSLAESIFEFEVINKDENTGPIKLAVSVLPENIVNAYVELFESNGITPISFDLESQAIARAVMWQKDKSASLIINLSFEKTGFYVVEEGVVQFSTTFPYSVGEDDSYATLNNLKAEMHKVVAFWDARSGSKIEKAILCGSGSSNPEFVEKLMEESDVKYGLPDILLNQSIDYAVALGLVMPQV